MPVVRFHCPFVGLSGCQDGGGNGLTKTSLITHFRDRHCCGEAQAITKHSLLTDLAVLERAELTLKRMGLWLCGPFDHVNDGESDLHGSFTLTLIDNLFSKGLCGSLQLLRETLAESSPTFVDVDDDDLDLGEQNIKQCKRKICDGHYTDAVRVLSSSGVAPYSEATLDDLKTKHPFHPSPSFPHIPTNHHHLIASSTVVLDKIKSFPYGTSCGRDGLRAQHIMDCLSGAVVITPRILGHC
ncbi:hypothetical protein Tco_1557199, partial [Tanacetum coccineum]